MGSLIVLLLILSRIGSRLFLFQVDRKIDFLNRTRHEGSVAKYNLWFANNNIVTSELITIRQFRRFVWLLRWGGSGFDVIGVLVSILNIIVILINVHIIKYFLYFLNSEIFDRTFVVFVIGSRWVGFGGWIGLLSVHVL